MKKYYVALLMLASSSSAFSYTDCTVNLSNVYVGDSGTVYIIYAGGGGMSISSSNSDQKNALALALAALMGGKPVTVRSNSNGASCTAVLTDFRGIYINNN